MTIYLWPANGPGLTWGWSINKEGPPIGQDQYVNWDKNKCRIMAINRCIEWYRFCNKRFEIEDARITMGKLLSSTYKD